MNFAIISYNSNFPVKDFIERVIRWAIANKHQIYISESVFAICADTCEHLPKIVIDDEEAINAADVVISVGGDGTLLRAARLVVGKNKPILGINIGRLGFLANINQDKIENALEYTTNGQYEIDKRQLLKADLSDGTTHYALNESLFSKGPKGSMITIDAYYDDIFINKYWSDGLIIASPTGSTAYNMSAGGPIIMPGTDVMVLNPINPHTLTTRPLVLSSSRPLTIKADIKNQEVIFSKDGEIADIVGDELVVKIHKSKHAIDLIKLPGQTYFDTLRNKLMWGMDVRGNKPDH
jgi:NAD+ kinase